ncbi:oligosaccharide flippase family protein [Aquihabitans sp. McL0605]|uniref:oligosaccharide flippase family protein n=1 Tax=Aquihabitans sp. McL0605 TaxID=3415671 RepID=UPI003CF173EE
MEAEADFAPPRSGRQTAVIAGGRIGAAALSALWLIVAARQLTLDQFSDLALVLALGSALFFLTDAGYSNLLSAHVAALGSIQRRAVTATIDRRIRGSIIALVILVPGYLVAANDADPIIPLLFLGSLIGNAIHGSIVAAFRSIGHSRAEATNEVVSRSLLLVVGWLWLSNGGGVEAAVILYSLTDLASAVVLSIVGIRWIRAHAAPAEPLPDLHWRRALPIAIGSGFATIYGRLDTWLVALLAPAGTSGIYAACYRITETLRLPAQASGAVTLADVGREGDDGLALARGRAFHYVGLTAIPATILVIGAEPILRLLFGHEFAAGAPILRVLALSSLASAVVSVLGPTVSVATGRRYAIAVSVVTALNVVMNLILIPHLGGTGGAWANVASEAALAGLLLAALRNRQGLVNT